MTGGGRFAALDLEDEGAGQLVLFHHPGTGGGGGSDHLFRAAGIARTITTGVTGSGCGPRPCGC